MFWSETRSPCLFRGRRRRRRPRRARLPRRRTVTTARRSRRRRGKCHAADPFLLARRYLQAVRSLEESVSASSSNAFCVSLDRFGQTGWHRFKNAGQAACKSFIVSCILSPVWHCFFDFCSARSPSKKASENGSPSKPKRNLVRAGAPLQRCASSNLQVLNRAEGLRF